MKRLLTTVIAVLFGATLAALAANTTFVTNVGDLVFPFAPPTTNPAAGGTIGDTARGGMAPVNGSLSFSKNVPLTGFSLTFGNFEADMTLRPAGTLATGTVTMAPAPIDGGKACIFSTQIVTALTVAANTGQTIVDNVTTIGANGRVCYLYSSSNTTWNRSQ